MTDTSTITDDRLEWHRELARRFHECPSDEARLWARYHEQAAAVREQELVRRYRLWCAAA